MKRLVLSIVAGFLVTAVLSTATDHIFHTTGVYPPYGQPFFDTELVLMAFTYRALFAILGAYITAVIAKHQSRKAVLILGTIGSVLWLAGGIAMWDYAPALYNVGGAILGVPFAFAGLKLYYRRTSATVA